MRPSCTLTLPFLCKLPMFTVKASFQIRLGNQTDLTPNPRSPQGYFRQQKCLRACSTPTGQ